jgi:3-methylfumaryl-CoA hydratase
VTTVDIDKLREWIGRSERSVDVVTPRLVAALRATLEIPGDEGGDPVPLPASIHWCLAPQIERMSNLGADGHPARGGFLPPVPLARRMWAGSEVAFHDRLRVGDDVVRESRVADIAVKTGKTGLLCFVTVQHAFSTARGPAISERQDIVYRDQSGRDRPGAATTPVPRKGQWHREIKADTVLLFRYSALTFNGHRIHYDRAYSNEHEGYPGLVVHGPLQASYLLELATAVRGQVPGRFSFRAVEPLFEGDVLTLNADERDGGLELWAAGGDGRPTLQAQASW